MKLCFLLFLALTCGLPAAHARGGSGGTTGGNPKPVRAPHFTQDPVRAAKLSAAVAILRERIPQSCLAEDYKHTLLTEMERLVSRNELYYFPEAVMLGADRYSGDYTESRLQNGDYEFFKVGAFTKKVKGLPIYFTRDSDAYDAEELALTFVQDLNDHVLQWNEEASLNAVGEMVMGRRPCDPHKFSVYGVASLFPEREPRFEERKAEFFRNLEAELKEKGSVRLGSIPNGYEIESFRRTARGFAYTPKRFYYWDGSGTMKVVPVKNPQPQEVVFSPFHYVKMENLAAADDGLDGIVRDQATGVVLTEFEYTFRDPSFRRRLNMDPVCEYREFDANDSLRRPVHHTNASCDVNIAGGVMELTIQRKGDAFCDEDSALDSFTLTKDVEDLAKELVCHRGDYGRFTKENYARILGAKDLETYVGELKARNEEYYRSRGELPAGVSPWIAKNIYGGRLEALPDHLSIVRDDQGRLYSFYLGIRGVYQNAEEVEDLDDDDDEAYQCFFRGPRAGTCAFRRYDD